MAPSLPAAAAAAAHRPARRRVPLLLMAILLTAVLLVPLLAACARQLELEPLRPDPGIAAALSVVQGRTETLFAELERTPGLPFAEAEAIHYRPLLADLAQAQKLARLHERSAEERRALDALAATYEELRTRHRRGPLDVQTRADLRARLDAQLEALLRMERG